MPLIPFPSVPKLPGVPALPRSAKFPPIVRAGLGLLQGMLWRIFQVQTRWGIWDSKGKPLGDPSKFTGLIGNALEAAGFTSVFNVLHGFEGELDDVHHRGSMNGWRFEGLPWEQC